MLTAPMATNRHRPRASSGVALRVLLPLIETLPRLGVAARDAAACFGVDLDAAAPDARVPGAQVGAAFDRLAEMTGEPNVGLALARAFTYGKFGVLDHVAGASRNLRAQLEWVIRYYGIFASDVVLALEERPIESRLVWTYTRGLPRTRHLTELAVGIAARRMWDTIGPRMTLRRVSFTHGRPADTTTHAQIFRAPIAFGARANELVFESAVLDLPCLAADPCLVDALGAYLRALEHRSSVRDPFVARARQLVAGSLVSGEQNVGALAAALGTTPRTLQRELQARGTSYAKLLDEVRFAEGAKLLESGLSVAHVAARLGFADAAALYRAYRRWTGAALGARKRR